MEKIQALLEKAGVKPELSSEICEAFEKYRAMLREQLEAEYTAKVEEAKKVCVEEVNAHKRELARRLQIFVETKSNAIEASLLKQSAIRDTEATTKLRQITSLVEGIEPNGAPNGQSQAVVENLKAKVKSLSEECQKATEVANRQTALAEKVLGRNRQLETELARHRNDGQSLQESRRQPQPQKRQRIDGQRTSGRPSTTRQTLVENQDRRPPQPQRRPAQPTGTGYSIEDLAARMETDLV